MHIDIFVPYRTAATGPDGFVFMHLFISDPFGLKRPPPADLAVPAAAL